MPAYEPIIAVPDPADWLAKYRTETPKEAADLVKGILKMKPAEREELTTYILAALLADFGARIGNEHRAQEILAALESQGVTRQ
jgi:hypothetical protein